MRRRKKEHILRDRRNYQVMALGVGGYRSPQQVDVSPLPLKEAGREFTVYPLPVVPARRVMAVVFVARRVVWTRLAGLEKGRQVVVKRASKNVKSMHAHEMEHKALTSQPFSHGRGNNFSPRA